MAETLSSCIFGALPLPPLPQLGLREESKCDTVFNTHDVIASSMQNAAANFNENTHTARLQKQEQLQERLNADLDSLLKQYEQMPGEGEREKLSTIVYDIYQRYTREFLAAFMPWQKEIPDIRFTPMQDVPHESVVADAARSHLKSMCIHTGFEVPAGETFGKLSYQDIILFFAFVYVNSE